MITIIHVIKRNDTPLCYSCIYNIVLPHVLNNGLKYPIAL